MQSSAPASTTQAIRTRHARGKEQELLSDSPKRSRLSASMRDSFTTPEVRSFVGLASEMQNPMCFDGSRPEPGSALETRASEHRPAELGDGGAHSSSCPRAPALGSAPPEQDPFPRRHTSKSPEPTGPELSYSQRRLLRQASPAQDSKH